MIHYADFAPYTIADRNQRLRSEVDSLRLRARLRNNRNPASITPIYREPEADLPALKKAS